MNTEHTNVDYPKIELSNMLRGVLKSCRHMWINGMVLMVALAGLMCLRTWQTYTPVYQASASFTVKVANPFYSNQQYYNSSAAEQMAKTFPYILTSGVLSEQVKDTLGISFMPSVSAEALGNTNIISLTVTSGDPQLAYDVLNCVIDVYPSVSEFVIGPTSMTLLSESGVPTTPIREPNYMRSAVYGGILGLAIWMALAMLYWVTHKTVNNEDELAKIVNIPCLGRIPKVRGYGKKEDACPILNQNSNKIGFDESVRLLRVRVEKTLAQQNGQVVLVTSTLPDEGKTTVSLNLATALAQKGKKTFLIDCDLRNPSVAKMLGIEEKAGFAELIKGERSFNEVFRRMETKNLYMILGGKPVSNPEALLGRRVVGEFMKVARKSFDYIILDTPPSALMADASELGALADCAILTVRQDFASHQQIQECVQMLDDSKVTLAGCVLNMTTQKRSKDGYGSYYGYGSYGQKGSKEGGNYE